MKRLLIIGVVFASIQVMAQDPVDPFLVMAAENNPGLKSKFSAYLSSMEQIPQAKALPDPHVAFGVFVQPVETRVGAQRASLAISQSFPWFGTLRSKAEVALQMSEAQLMAFEDEKLRLFREVSVLYNELYFLQKAVKLTTDNLQVLTSFKELARVNFESGKTGFVNVLRVEMEEQELRTKLAFLQDSQTSAMAEFENLLNKELETPLVFPDSLTIIPLNADVQMLSDSIVGRNLKLQELQYQVSAKNNQIEVFKLMAKPSFTVTASYINIAERNDVEISDNGKDAILFPQVGLRIPLSGKKYQAMQKQAKLQKESIQYTIEEQSNRFSSQMEHLVRDHLDAQRRIKLYMYLHDLAERSLSLLQTEFITGTADFEEVLRMERKHLTYQLELEKARVDNNSTVYKINYLVGK